jgi:hypothetical protein
MGDPTALLLAGSRRTCRSTPAWEPLIPGCLRLARCRSQRRQPARQRLAAAAHLDHVRLCFAFSPCVRFSSPPIAAPAASGFTRMRAAQRLGSSGDACEGIAGPVDGGALWTAMENAAHLCAPSRFRSAAFPTAAHRAWKIGSRTAALRPAPPTVADFPHRPQARRRVYTFFRSKRKRRCDGWPGAGRRVHYPRTSPATPRLQRHPLSDGA